MDVSCVYVCAMLTRVAHLLQVFDYQLTTSHQLEMVEYEKAQRDPRTLICKVVVALISAALVIMINYGVFSSECGDDGCTLKAYHPLFMSLGFLFFMTSAILSYIGAGDRVLARRMHVILQCIAFVCMIIGISIIVSWKESRNYNTLHF